jgi:hypothetical protein
MALAPKEDDGAARSNKAAQLEQVLWEILRGTKGDSSLH